MTVKYDRFKDETQYLSPLATLKSAHYSAIMMAMAQCKKQNCRPASKEYINITVAFINPSSAFKLKIEGGVGGGFSTINFLPNGNERFAKLTSALPSDSMPAAMAGVLIVLPANEYHEPVRSSSLEAQIEGEELDLTPALPMLRDFGAKLASLPGTESR